MNEPDPGQRRAAVAAWVGHADADRRSAMLCLAAQPPLPGIAAFHCQQAIEKSLKALLVLASAPVRKTHSLVELGDAVARQFPSLGALVRQAEPVTLWGVAYRYPAEEMPEEFPDEAAFANAFSIVDHLTKAIHFELDRTK
jgi:HEPN domain-containing protein